MNGLDMSYAFASLVSDVNVHISYTPTYVSKLVNILVLQIATEMIWCFTDIHWK